MLDEIENIINDPGNVTIYLKNVRVEYKGECLYKSCYVLGEVLNRLIDENKQRVLQEVANNLYQILAEQAEEAKEICNKAADYLKLHDPDQNL